VILTPLLLSKQIGDILQTFAKSTDAIADTASAETLSSLLTSPSVIAKLVFLSLLSLGPVLMREKLTALLSGGKKSEDDDEKTQSLIRNFEDNYD